MNFRRGRQADEIDITLNLVSLIDVLLCLLIFFMVSTTFVQKVNINLKLPTADNAKDKEEPLKSDDIEVSIGANGSTFVDHVEVVSPTAKDIRNALADAVNRKQQARVVVSADRRTTHQSLVTVLDAATELGVSRLSLTAETDTN